MKAAFGFRGVCAIGTGLLVVASLSGCGAAGEDTATAEREVSVVMNWLPQAEQGGFWDLSASGIDKKNGLSVTIQPGGPQIQTIPQVASGQAQFGRANADQILLARAQGVPVVGIWANFDTYPQCLIYHPESGIKKIEDVNEHPVAVSPGPNYWLWVKSHYKLDNVDEINYTGSLSEFARNDQLVQQCFAFNEPQLAEAQGLSHAEFLISDLGYNPYSGVLFTTEKMIKDNPDLVQSMVDAADEGWIQYMNDPEVGNEAIKNAGGQEDSGQLEFVHETMKSFFGAPIGSMVPDRWEALASQMKDAGLVKTDVDWTKAFTTQFLN